MKSLVFTQVRALSIFTFPPFQEHLESQSWVSIVLTLAASQADIGPLAPLVTVLYLFYL